MSPDQLRLYQPYQIDDDRSISIFQFAGIIVSPDGTQAFSFIPWNVHSNPEVNRSLAFTLGATKLFQVSPYSRQ